MLAMIAVVAGAYSLFWYSGGPDFGARYWYLLLVPFIALTVGGARVLATRLPLAPAPALAHARLMIAVLSLCILSLLSYTPWRALDKYYHYLGMKPDIAELARQYAFGKSLVLIRGDSFPDYASAWVYNPLDPQADAPIYAWDRDAQLRQSLLNAYPDRVVWGVDGPSITGGDFKVVFGPLTVSEMRGQADEER
jgi:hypothetical protein